MHEPLLHFLLLGALIFVAFKFISRETSEPGKILITQGRIASLETAFSGTWRRPPTGSELEGLIRDYVREEVFAREAVALGLDKDDTIIRRRLRQKLEFISEDVAAQAEPTDDQLRAYLKEHPDTFRGDRRFTFSQVYLDPSGAAPILPAIQRKYSRSFASLPAVNPTSQRLAIQLMLENAFEALPASEVVKQFGEKFAASARGDDNGTMARADRVRLRHASGFAERAHRRLPAGAGRGACGGASRMDQRAPAGSEREVLSNPVNATS